MPQSNITFFSLRVDKQGKGVSQAAAAAALGVCEGGRGERIVVCRGERVMCAAVAAAVAAADASAAWVLLVQMPPPPKIVCMSAPPPAFHAS